MELMLAVVLIGLIYGLFINNMQRYGAKAFELNLISLPEYLQKFHDKNRVAMVCIDQCRECFVSQDGQVVQSVEPFVDSTIRLYRFDRYSGTRDIELTPYFDDEGNEEEACFRYELFPDGSSTEMMVEYAKGVVLFPGYFGDVKRFDSLSAAVDYKMQLIEKVLR